MNSVNLKTALFAATAAAALLGAAIIGVPSSSDRATPPMHMGTTPR
jgi:hypothetical protein